MYTAPELYQTNDFLCVVDDVKLRACEKECVRESPYPCDETVFEICMIIMLENNWIYPTDAVQACELYLDLRHELLLIL